MRETTRVLSGAALGATTFAAAHLIIVSRWSAWFGGTSDRAPYWMNSADATPILFTAAAVFAATALVTLFSTGGDGTTRAANARAGDAEQRLRNAATAVGSITAGAVMAMVVVLFTGRGGPGTLFPMAIVLGAIVLLFASALGAAAGTATLLLGRWAE